MPRDRYEEWLNEELAKDQKRLNELEQEYEQVKIRLDFTERAKKAYLERRPSNVSASVKVATVVDTAVGILAATSIVNGMEKTEMVTRDLVNSIVRKGVGSTKRSISNILNQEAQKTNGSRLYCRGSQRNKKWGLTEWQTPEPTAAPVA